MKNLLLVATLAFAIACGGSPQKKLQVNTSTETASVSKKVNLNIEGMSCSKGCVKKIKAKVASISGVSSVDIDFDSKVATIVSSEEVEENALVEAINGIEGGQYTASVPVEGEETEEKTN